MSLSKVILKYQKGNTKVFVYSFDTPVDKIVAVADDNFIYAVIFEDSKVFEKTFQILYDNLSCELVMNKNSILEQFEEELDAYFKGKLKVFTVPLKTFGTDFQEAIWKKLQELPYESTQTYGDLAKSLGRTASHSRAIGAACGANSHLIVVPCHRLVASGTKGGFSSGIDRKKWLLEHEKNNL